MSQDDKILDWLRVLFFPWVTPGTKIRNFIPTDPKHKFHKARIENWVLIEFPLLETHSYNHRLGTCWVKFPYGNPQFNQ